MKSYFPLFLIFSLLICIIIPSTLASPVKASFDVSYQETIFTIDDKTAWWGGPIIDYTVSGIGRHSIYWELNYSIYTLSTRMPQPQNGTFQGNDSIYLFNLHQKPLTKHKATFYMFFPFFFYDRGIFTGKLYIDDNLVAQQTLNYVHE